MTTIGESLRAARKRLAAGGSEAPAREARLLLGHLLGRREAQLVGRDAEPLAPEIQARFLALLERRARGEPVAYLTGEKEFWGLTFAVDARVLVPRPETEHLIEVALALALPESFRFLDLGTGSGCLAVALANERRQARGLASDRSLAALALARANARRHGVDDRLRFLAASLADGFAVGAFDLVLTNPPYLDPAHAGELPTDVRDFEPAAALFGGAGGTALLARILGELAPALRSGAWLLAEIGAGQSEWVEATLDRTHLRLERVVPDLAGVPRVVVVRRR